MRRALLVGGTSAFEHIRSAISARSGAFPKVLREIRFANILRACPARQASGAYRTNRSTFHRLRPSPKSEREPHLSHARPALPFVASAGIEPGKCADSLRRADG